MIRPWFFGRDCTPMSFQGLCNARAVALGLSYLSCCNYRTEAIMISSRSRASRSPTDHMSSSTLSSSPSTHGGQPTRRYVVCSSSMPANGLRLKIGDWRSSSAITTTAPSSKSPDQMPKSPVSAMKNTLPARYSVLLAPNVDSRRPLCPFRDVVARIELVL